MSYELFILNAPKTLTYALVNKLQNINNKRKDVIEQIYVSSMVLRLKLLANTEGSNARNLSDVTDYHKVVRFIFEYAEKGAFEKDAEFR